MILRIVLLFLFINLVFCGGPVREMAASIEEDNLCPTCQDVYTLDAYANNCYCAYPLRSTLNQIVAIPIGYDVILGGCCFDSFEEDPNNQGWTKFEIYPYKS
ncbi:hypothetical protein PVAND_014790 [Polypedilum vanderplanki]|uniref:Uncharacterized protein n=1 Tax=Polypedilum vanderplanki TaxID=319348 RepID=A0A9J6BAE6_POLVA|nr:hypothetical protein PVAND_014790 [Polypedilum vanderplanki]